MSKVKLVDPHILSDRKCACGKPLKMNLVIKHPDADQCYSCHVKDNVLEGRREYYPEWKPATKHIN